MAVRTGSRPPLSSTCNNYCDAVAILPLIKDKEDGTNVLLIKQFRPPTGKPCYELPAGLVDPDESIETAALRELLEETGYTGTIRNSSSNNSTSSSSSPLLFASPGMSNETMKLVTVDIDPWNPPENQNPKPNWQDDEFIQVVQVPVSQLLTFLHNEYETNGVAIDSRLYSIAYGLHLSSSISLSS